MLGLTPLIHQLADEAGWEDFDLLVKILAWVERQGMMPCLEDYLIGEVEDEFED